MKNPARWFAVIVSALFLSSCSSISLNSSSQEDALSNGGKNVNGVTLDATAIYASPKGGGTTAKGTKEDPYNLPYAIQLSKPGHCVYLLEGVYAYSYPIKIESASETYPSKGTDEMKTLMPALNDDLSEQKVTFDFSSMSFYSSNRGLSINSDFWHLKDFEVKGAGDNGVYVGGNHNIIENLDIHDCQDSGLQLGRKSSSDVTINQWPTDNLILNCTSHDNHDPTGEDSDGFACKLTTGYGNVFDGCIAYNNVDDGWDLYTKSETGPIGPVTIRNCVSFNNGITSYGVGTPNSDGNGFKLGGEVIPVNHKVINSIAFNNCAHGFTDNSNPGTILLQNCTSYNNGTRDWDCENVNMCRDSATSYNSFKNILSFCEGRKTSPITGETTLANSKDEYRGNASYSVFYYGLAMMRFASIEECDSSNSGKRGSLLQEDVSSPFVSVESPQSQSSSGVPVKEHFDLHRLLRSADGTIKLGSFLKLKASSPFAAMGENGAPLGANLSGEEN